jgi:hypothetical protein
LGSHMMEDTERPIDRKEEEEESMTPGRDKEEASFVNAEAKKQQKGKTETKGGKKRKQEEKEVTSDPWGWNKKEPVPGPCRHGSYEEEVTYKAEKNSGYILEGYYLFKLKCGECSRLFVPDRREEQRIGPEKCFRMTSDAPIYCCVNIAGRDSSRGLVAGHTPCEFALCAKCFRDGINKEDNTAGRQRSKRVRN